MRFLIYLTFIFSSTANAGDIHKWVDEDGNVHYSDSPPVSVSTKQVRVIGAPSNPGKPLPRLGDNSSDNRTNTTANAAEGESASPDVPEDQAKIACDNAQKDLEVLKSSDRIQLRATDGTTRYMTTEEIAERLAKTEKDVERFCQ
ncbi:MAG: DUF4124 domain-containing protein [Gammaproteobacteria bacterium]|nr:DUF4124 domain-containing protein [Gammaproteobacteria bacterium]